MAVVRRGDYRVSVYSDGREVKNFSQPLVQRVTLSSQDLLRFLSLRPEGFSQVFQTKVERDRSGSVRGFRLVAATEPSDYARFGLQPGDIVTAIGAKRAESVSDFSELFSGLRARGRSSMTLERNYQPHKVIFYVQGPDGGGKVAEDEQRR